MAKVPQRHTMGKFLREVWSYALLLVIKFAVSCHVLSFEVRPSKHVYLRHDHLVCHHQEMAAKGECLVFLASSARAKLFGVKSQYLSYFSVHIFTSFSSCKFFLGCFFLGRAPRNHQSRIHLYRFKQQQTDKQTGISSQQRLVNLKEEVENWE